MSVKIIKYPLFLSASTLTTDEYWRSLFEDLSYGICPYGTYMYKDCICSSFKGKEFTYKIEGTDHVKIYNDIYGLLNKKMNIMSNIDKLSKRTNYNSIGQSIINTKLTWSSIKKKNTKDTLIEEFVINMKAKYKLTFKQSRILLSELNTFFCLKVLSSKDVVYKEGSINSINGVTFKKGSFEITKDMKLKRLNNIVQLSESKLMSDNWISKCS